MAIAHKQSSSWRVVGRGNSWQPQQLITTEASGKSWWDIGPAQPSRQAAELVMYVREPLKDSAT